MANIEGIFWMSVSVPYVHGRPKLIEKFNLAIEIIDIYYFYGKTSINISIISMGFANTTQRQRRRESGVIFPYMDVATPF
jgi:hypothetical protein